MKHVKGYACVTSWLLLCLIVSGTHATLLAQQGQTATAASAPVAAPTPKASGTLKPDTTNSKYSK